MDSLAIHFGILSMSGDGTPGVNSCGNPSVTEDLRDHSHARPSPGLRWTPSPARSKGPRNARRCRCRRVSAISGPTSATFAYDGLGRRRQKTLSGTTIDFLYDGLNTVQEQTGGTAANLLIGLGIDERFLRSTPTETRDLVVDALGSTVALADASGTLQTTYTYEAFGTATVAGAPSTNPYAYTGREDDGTGLHYYRARYYHPALQRFISEDPLAESRNLYPYARNNPLRYVDPRGEAEIRAFGHTFNVFVSATVGVINFQADLNQVNLNFVVAPSFGIGADFLIDIPADAVTLQVGPTRNLAVGTALVQAEEGCTLCLGGIQAQGVIISVTPFAVPVAPVPVFLTAPITTIYADPSRKPPPVIFPSLLPSMSARSAGPTILGKRK